MNKRYQEYLYRRYPVLFRDKDKPLSESRMIEGIMCGSGWYHIINDTCQQLEFLSKRFGVVISFFQIKEKFTVLNMNINEIRFNAPQPTRSEQDIIHDIVKRILHYAEWQSGLLCERCGEPRVNRPRKHGLILYARCDECWKRFRQKIRKDKKNK